MVVKDDSDNMGEEEKAKDSRTVTSLKIDPTLWKEAKIEAIRQGESLSELVERAVKKELVVLKGKKG